jgi:hypothetical protein
VRQALDLQVFPEPGFGRADDTVEDEDSRHQRIPREMTGDRGMVRGHDQWF